MENTKKILDKIIEEYEAGYINTYQDVWDEFWFFVPEFNLNITEEEAEVIVKQLCKKLNLTDENKIEWFINTRLEIYSNSETIDESVLKHLCEKDNLDYESVENYLISNDWIINSNEDEWLEEAEQELLDEYDYEISEEEITEWLEQNKPIYSPGDIKALSSYLISNGWSIKDNDEDDFKSDNYDDENESNEEDKDECLNDFNIYLKRKFDYENGDGIITKKQIEKEIPKFCYDSYYSSYDAFMLRDEIPLDEIIDYLEDSGWSVD